jgi:phosphate-selective porin OprO/OprP
MRRPALFLYIPLCLALAAVIPGMAQAAGSSGYDAVWSKARLFTGQDNDFFQSIDLSGRLQFDLAFVENAGDSDSEFNVRRFRFGFKTKLKHHLILHIEGEFDPQEADPFYQRLTDSYLAWEANERLRITAGKHSAGFTLDGLTSSKNLITIDRNNLTNNIWFTEEYIPGLSVSGKSGSLRYFAGVFSSGDKNREFGDFEGGSFGLFRLGKDFAVQAGADEAFLDFNYVHNQPDPENGFTNDLKDIASLNFRYRKGPWGVRTDLSAGKGYDGQSDLWGVVLMPFRDFGPHWQVVGRYTYIDSKDPNGIRFGRYERNLALGRGDRYSEFHLGFNYYWYGHRLKLQNGLQHVDMRDQAGDGGDYSGWSWTTGFRINW